MVAKTKPRPIDSKNNRPKKRIVQKTPPKNPLRTGQQSNMAAVKVAEEDGEDTLGGVGGGTWWFMAWSVIFTTSHV